MAATAVYQLPPEHTVSSIDVSDVNTVLTTYQDYPVTQPFIHDTYRRQDKPIKSFPESNRQGKIHTEMLGGEVFRLCIVLLAVGCDLVLYKGWTH